MKEIAQYLLKEFVKRGADDVVISVERVDATQIKFTNSKISTTQSWHNANLELFLAMGKKLVTTSVKDTSIEAAKDAVDRILKFAESASPNPEYQGIAQGPFDYKSKSIYDDNLANLGEEIVEYAKQGINSATVKGAVRTAGIVQTETNSRYILTSNNVEVEDRGTRAYFSLRAFADKDSSGHKVTNSRNLKDFNVVDPAEKAAEISKKSINSKQGEAGVYDVYFEPLALANILNQVGDSASVFNIDAGLSCFNEKINKQVASTDVTLYDDGTHPEGYNSVRFDDEGVPTQSNTIIENGVLKTYLHNTSTARKYQTKTTANAGLIDPTPHNIILKNGNINKEEMYNEIKKGILITNTWYTRFQNHATGDFSTIPRDGMFIINNGKVEQPIKGLRISENLINLLQNFKTIAKEQEKIYGWEAETPVICPAAIVSNVRLTRSTA